MIHPSHLSVINCSLTSGTVPVILNMLWYDRYKKKTNLDPAIVSNYRPVILLPFMCKILEKVVLTQLLSFLEANHIYEVFQSGFRSLYSTEIALLRVLNDILLSVDTGVSSALVHLDLTAKSILFIVMLKFIYHCLKKTQLSLSLLKD